MSNVIGGKPFPVTLVDFDRTLWIEQQPYTTVKCGELTLPAEVDCGKRLVLFLLGLSLARRPTDDAGYRVVAATL